MDLALKDLTYLRCIPCHVCCGNEDTLAMAGRPWAITSVWVFKYEFWFIIESAVI